MREPAPETNKINEKKKKKKTLDLAKGGNSNVLVPVHGLIIRVFPVYVHAAKECQLSS